jgi:putative endopeptidase
MRSGIEHDNVDAQVRPQDDLFRHVNGRWLDTAEIPPDRAIDGAFLLLRDRAEDHLRAIIEKAVAGEPADDDDARKIGALYASFMDTEAIEARGAEPLRADLDRIDEVRDVDGFVRLLGELQRQGVGGAFGVYVDTDPKQSDRYVVNLWQGGLALPDESYYRDDRYAPIRSAYVEHLERILALAGLDDAAERARRVMDLETALAAGHWDTVASRDRTKTYNPMDHAALQALIPAFDGVVWAEGLGAPPGAFEQVVVRQPSYLEAMSRELESQPLQAWKDWLSAAVVRASAPYLAEALVDEWFGFYGRTLTGAEQNRERWRRGVQVVEGAMGQALGRLYVAEHFPPAAKERMSELVANLVEAYRRSIAELDWMGPETRERALEKLAAFTPKIGYPDTWRDYSALDTDRTDVLGNVRRAAAFELARQLAKIGTPVDRSEWLMTPQTVNAYYNPGMNEIVFPAAILQPPFFDLEADDAVNYGGIGAVIGHEIGHGFDDQGSKYDGAGNMSDWWTEADRAEFDKRTARLVAQYSELSPEQLPGHKVNGALTVGENIGDLGGLAIAVRAYRLALDGGCAEELDGLSGLQRLFFGWAQVWRAKARDAEVLRRLAIDPHSPNELRCNAVVRNIDDFHEAFEVTEGDRLWLAPDERVRIW